MGNLQMKNNGVIINIYSIGFMGMLAASVTDQQT